MKIHQSPKLPSSVSIFPLKLEQTDKALVVLEAMRYKKYLALNTRITLIGQMHIAKKHDDLRHIEGRAYLGICSHSHRPAGSLREVL